MRHPLLIHRSALLAYGVAWALVATVQFFLLHFFMGYAPLPAIVDTVISVTLFAAMALSFWFPCRYLAPEDNTPLRIILSHMVTALAAAAIWVGLQSLLFPRLPLFPETYQLFFAVSRPWRIMLGVLLYGVMAAIYYVAIYYQNFHRQLLRQAELRSLVTEAQLKSLKFQINPHFIFNSLNSLYALILENPEKAGVMALRLAQFLRMTLSGEEKPTRPLGQELAAARLYLQIEKARFGEKIQYRESVPPDHHAYHVPVMLLQPLLENAIKHGVCESLVPVPVSLHSQVRNGYLELQLDNAVDPAVVSKKGPGVGLANIRERLYLLYRERDLLHIEKTATHFRVRVRVPTESALPAQSAVSRESGS